ncbi:MAG: DUF3368 domain-containing protein [bacterium]|nr:DUF3368 domain-containing protein [bacterium]
MRIVCDTGPIVSLAEADLLPLLSLAGSVFIPPAVRAELLTLTPPEWLRVTALEESRSEDVRRWLQAGVLDQGEAQALSLARQLKADWFLTDDAAARMLAQDLGLEVHGSLGVVLWAAAVGHLGLEEGVVALDRLSRSSLWISARVMEEARAALQRLCS